jgi:DNA-directed RNA polymerase specialized sigma subunit
MNLYVTTDPGDKILFLTEDEVKQLIEDIVNATVLKMKMAGLLKDDRRTATEKLEELLRSYPTLASIHDKEYTVKLVEKVDEALKSISDDPYFDVIRMFYFEGLTREYIALEFDTSITTISRNKTRLLNQLKLMLFSDDVIYELFL